MDEKCVVLAHVSYERFKKMIIAEFAEHQIVITRVNFSLTYTGPFSKAKFTLTVVGHKEADVLALFPRVLENIGYVVDPEYTDVSVMVITIQ
jgi:hypothetical protein